jgi:hypothetical protein
MGWHSERALYAYCDWPGCNYEQIIGASSLEKCIRELLEYGWSVSYAPTQGGEDGDRACRCPEHAGRPFPKDPFRLTDMVGSVDGTGPCYEPDGYKRRLHRATAKVPLLPLLS